MYVLMLASLIDVNKAVFITASAFNGVGAALLWTAEVWLVGQGFQLVDGRPAVLAHRLTRPNSRSINAPPGLDSSQGAAITRSSSPQTRGRNAGE